MNELRLAPPGAGLPLLQKIFLRWYLGPFVSKRSTWSTSKPMFEKLHARIEQETQDLSDEQLSRRVLVPSLPGIEDSSRHWSIAMVLEHLVIVGTQMEAGIVALSQGSAPSGEVDIAAVKPHGQKTPAQSLEEFRAFYKGAPARIESRIGDWNSSATKVHPWFGPFTCRQWAWLLAGHGAIHLRQVREIKKRL